MLHGIAVLTIEKQWELSRIGRGSDELAERVIRFFTAASTRALKEPAEALERAVRKKSAPADTGAMSFASADVPKEGAVRPRLRHKTDAPSELQRLFRASRALRRARERQHVIQGARILWLDDHPKWSQDEITVLKGLGATVVCAEDTESALAILSRDSVDVIVSGIHRSGVHDEGVRALPRLRECSSRTPVIFYVARLKEGTSLPSGAFGITKDTEELLHLVFDALERTRP